MASQSEEHSNPFFVSEVSNICATCTKHLFKGRSYSLDIPVDLTADVNLYHVLESQFEFKYEENGPSNLCTECFSKTLLFYEFHQQCKSSVMLFSKYMECQKQFTTPEDIGLVICDTAENSTTVDEESDVKLTIESEELCDNVLVKAEDEFDSLKEFESIDNDSLKEFERIDNESLEEFVSIDNDSLKEFESIDNDMICNSNESDSQSTGPSVRGPLSFQKEVETIQPAAECLPKCNKTKRQKRKSYMLTEICQQKKLYRCTLCDAVYENYNTFQGHRSLHKKQYVCSYCHKALRTISALRIHERSHTGERPFSCGKCGKAFTSKTNMESHLLSHDEKRPFKCTFCAKTYKTKGALTRHMQIHTGDKPFECSECKASFVYLCNLKNHVKQVHAKATTDEGNTEK